MLSEVSQRRRNIVWHPSYVESEKMIQMNLLIGQKKTHRLRKWTYGCRGRGEGWGEGIVREFGMGTYTLLYLKCITNNIYYMLDLLYSTWNSAQCYVAAWMGGGFRGEWIHVDVWLNPFAIHLKLSQHCLLMAISQYKIKSLKKPVADSCQCMAKPIQYCKVISLQLK